MPGALVAIDIKKSEVLAAVTYPSYNLSSYTSDYAENAANPLYPFLNRAFSGVYAPGSCFKPVVAVAGLAQGVINPDSRVDCQRVYTFFPSYQPTCLSYHGQLTVVDALRASCNIFFYDTEEKLGIEAVNQTARELGLGALAGIELSESLGTQTNPANAMPGDALQVAIGQLDNGYTPLQLANYAATLARNGELRKVSLIKGITSYFDAKADEKRASAPVLGRVEPFAGV
jgi:penicillin-binding protein 2